MDSTDEGEGRRGFDLAEKVFVLGVLALVAAPVIKRWVNRYRELSYRDQVQEPTLD